MDVWTALLGRGSYLPHGYCFTWTPGLLWSMVGADGVIALAYFSIPLTILRFVRLRADLTMPRLAWLFSAFIFACGMTHVMDVWTVWQPDYGLQALAKVLTASVSMLTAVALWWLIPKALKIPSVSQLQTGIDLLEAEVRKRRSAEEHLRDTQQSLAATLASIGAGFIATDRAGCVTRMNEVAERVTGWGEAEARGVSLRQVFDREDRPPAAAAMNPVETMLHDDIAVHAAYSMIAVSRDGERTALEVKAALTHAEDGAVRGLVVVFTDMTELARARAEAERLAAIVESSNDAIVGKTLDGRITSWNAAAAALFGYSAEEAIGQPIQMLVPVARRGEEMRILDMIRRGERIPAFETQRRAKDGRLIELSVAISPVHDANGRVVGASKIARDVTERRRAEAALRESEAARLEAARLEAENRQIQEANRLKSQFIANMSHELRTPLTAILGFADLLHSGAVPADAPQHRAFLGHIGSSGRHLLQLINDVLDLSKVEAGKFEFFPEPVDLGRLVAEVSDMLQTALQRKRLQLAVEIEASLGALSLDPSRLKQVLYNYLSNAIKFTPEGGHVTVRALAQGPSRWRLEVEDTGVGIAAKDIAGLFQEFHQIDAGYSKQHQGTGLGLALTRRLVEAQGGTVGVRSEPGRGSVFHFELDRRVASAPGQGERRVGLPAVTAARRLLLIGADPLEQARLVEALAEAGFQVDAAATGQQALRNARARAYDGIALELLLPDQHGFGVLESIRSEGPNHGAPVMGLMMPTQSGAAASFAITDVLRKPLHTGEIVAVLGRHRRPAPQRSSCIVIDDDPLALDLMRATLGNIGIDALCFADGRAALAEIESRRPDLIVLDLMMPVFDGFQTLDALRRLPGGGEIPVFIWTSMILMDEEYASLARSAHAIVGKGGGASAAMLESLRRGPGRADAGADQDAASGGATT